MKTRWIFPLLIALSMILAACAPAAAVTPTPIPPGEPSPTESIPATGSGTGVVVTPMDQPTPASVGTPGTIVVADNTEVTLADDGATVKMHVGQTFLLKLGEEFDWTVIPADQNVISRVKNISVIRGAQGIYQANQAGTTELAATGDPTCRSATPACAMPSRSFKVTVVVE